MACPHMSGLRGVVYDCAPGQLSAYTGIRAFLATRPPFALKLAFVGAPLTVGLGSVLLALWLGRRRLGTTVARMSALALLAALVDRWRTERYVRELAADSSECPQLFLYSKCDVLVSDVTVEDLICRRRARGVQVLTKKWESAGHMELLREDAAEYAGTLA